jgi:L-serine deaminase
VLRYLKEANRFSRDEIVRALATAGLVGNFVKTNASISGAEVGCQGEIGAACAMAAAGAAQLLGGTVRQIEYAAEMGLEHHLGLTCDPGEGLVQIPCIERNAFAATRAMDCADYALLSDGTHRISFDEVVETMKETVKKRTPFPGKIPNAPPTLWTRVKRITSPRRGREAAGARETAAHPLRRRSRRTITPERRR